MAKKKKPTNHKGKKAKQGDAKKATVKKKSSTKKVETVTVEDIRPAQDSLSFWSNSNLQMWLIFIFGCLLYSNTIGHDYAVDDSIVIERNAFTKKGLKGMSGIWGEDTFVGFFGGKRNLVAGGRYRPFTVATFALENQLFGSVEKNAQGQPKKDADGDIIYKGNPFFSHLINILLFGCLCLALYLWFLAMFAPEGGPDFRAFFIAVTAAILFAAHPLHVEAVANIKGRDEIMVTLGSILAAYWTMKSIKHPRGILYMMGAVLAFIVAIFSKESAIPFLAVIPAALYFFTKATPSTILLRTLPFVIVVAGFWFGIRNQILDLDAKGKPTPELMNDPYMKLAPTLDGRQAYTSFTASEKYGTILYTWLEYIRLMVVPHPLTNDYYPKHIRGLKNEIPTLTSPTVLLSILIHIILAILAFIGLLRRQPYAFALIFYAATFSVVSNLFFPIGTNMAERFMFMPSIGFSLLCGLGLVALGQYLNKENKKLLSLKTMKIPLYIFIVVTALYSIKTFTRNFDWYDDYTLFTKDIEVSHNSAKLNNAVSGVLQAKMQEANTSKADKIKMSSKALEHSKKAVAIHPTYSNAYLLLGNANVFVGDLKAEDKVYQEVIKYYDAGLKAYKEVYRLRPNHPDISRNLSITFRKKEQLLRVQLKQPQAATNYLQSELKWAESLFTKRDPKKVPDNGNPWLILGDLSLATASSFEKMNRFQEALTYYDKAIINFQNLGKEEPKNPNYRSSVLTTYREKGRLYGQRMGRLDASLQTLEAANQFAEGKDIEILRLIGVAYGMSQNHQKAIEHFEKALALNPSSTAILFNLEIAYRQLVELTQKSGDQTKAQQYLQKANEYNQKWKQIDPNYDPRKGQ